MQETMRGKVIKKGTRWDKNKGEMRWVCVFKMTKTSNLTLSDREQYSKLKKSMN